MEPKQRFLMIRERLVPLRTTLLEHPLYEVIDSVDNLRLFMQFHAFAVWDFMSLLKALQQRLCGCDVPWQPPRNPGTARFINEIVLAEESDEDAEGRFASHYEIYHRSMRQCGADTQSIDAFLAELQAGQSVRKAMVACDLDAAIQDFVTQTFALIESDNLISMASAFTFGREDLLPDIFQRMVDQLNAESGGTLDGFSYYLRRHIEVDGDSHGPLATEMVMQLCGDSESAWACAAAAAEQSLHARKRLWDGINEAIVQERSRTTGATSP